MPNKWAGSLPRGEHLNAQPPWKFVIFIITLTAACFLRKKASEAEIMISVIIIALLSSDFAKFCALGFALYAQNIETAHLREIKKAIKSCRLPPSPLHL